MCGSGFRVGKDTGVRGLWNLPPWWDRNGKDGCVAEKTLHGNPETLSREAVCGGLNSNVPPRSAHILEYLVRS